MRTSRTDAVVVGAGTAGANAAHQLAGRGLDVVLLERGAIDTAGAQWRNGVLDWQFERAGLAPPAGPERVAAHATSHVFGPDGTPGPTIVSPTVTADMGLLGQRLRGLATASAVRTVDRAGDLEVDVRNGRVVAVASSEERFEAALFVDASGRRGVLRQAAPVLAAACPPVEAADLCAAGDYTLRIADPDGAKRFLERHEASPTDAVNVLGTEGGWSTRSVTVAADLDQVHVLVGSVAAGGHGTPAVMLASVRRDEPWIGEQVEGAAGLIPLRRPYARLAGGGVALVGDAAAQVFPAHGSGIGAGLIAGRVLAEAVAATTDPGGDDALWTYSASFHLELGGVLAGYAAARRMSTALGTDGVGRMVRVGLLDAEMVRSGLDQRWATPGAGSAARAAVRLAGAPRLAATMLPWLARAQLAVAHGGRYPLEPDQHALDRWDRAMARLAG